MNIALIGGGGREHALCQKIFESKLTDKIVCLPGNPGTLKFAQNIEVNISDFKAVLKILKIYKIDMVVVGPEEPLVKGIVDFLKKKKIKVFGPNKYAAKLEGSKAFMKKLCYKNNIPTAKFKTCQNNRDVISFLNKSKLPLVVKADGLAAGKGVTVCKTKKQVLYYSKEIFKGKFKSSKKLILEEYLDGEEASYFIVVDENTFKFLDLLKIINELIESDTGPNTGGMGAYSPALIIDKTLEKKIIKKIIKPTLLELKKKKKAYRGFLYIGLMIKNKEPYLIEFNVRMGDPECQVILPRLKSDIVEIFKGSINDKLKNLKINWDNKKCMTIVLCSKGYPKKYKKNQKIGNLKKLKLSKNDFIFHAGTKIKKNKLLSDGGRVLNITSKGNNYSLIRKKILKIIKKINWKSGFFRKDIGWKVINNANN